MEWESAHTGLSDTGGQGSGRSRGFASKLGPSSLVAALLLALLAMPASAARQVTAGEEDRATDLVSGQGVDLEHAEELVGDLVYAEFSEGVSVIAPRGSVVEYEEGQRASEDGDEVEASASIRPPEDRADVEMPDVSAMELSLRSGMVGADRLEDIESQLAEEGITVDEAQEFIEEGLDGLAASLDQSEPEMTTSSTGSMFSDGCAEIDNAKHWIYGCYKRYYGNTTSTGRYYGQRSLATAKSKSHWMLVKARTHHDYSDGNGSVREWRPTSAVNRGECGTVSLGLTYQGASMSVSGNICPTKMEPAVGSNYFWSQWQSSWGAWRSARDTEALDVIWSSNAGGTGFVYRVYLQSRA